MQNSTNEMAMLLTHHQQSPIVYLSSSGILDFTDREASKVASIGISSAKGSNTINLGDEWLVRFFVKAANETIMAANKRLLVWDWKGIASFILGRYGVPLQPQCSIIDLKLIESHSDAHLGMPSNISEFMGRLRAASDSATWKLRQDVYRLVHLPLSMDVVPEMEAIGILGDTRLHAFYDIVGQENGRMLSHKAFSRGYVPHVLTPELRNQLKPIENHLFVYLDYRSMEVQMLAWLSRDDELARACSSDDIYASAYEMVTKTPCDSDEKRSMCKRFLLPIFYGMGAAGLEKSIGLPMAACESIVERVHGIFHVASAWMRSVQSTAESSGCYTDMLGKKRSFAEKHYRARNFAIQSPSAVFCMHGLVRLHGALKGIAKIAYNVHDGFMIYVTRDGMREAILAAQKALMSQSELFPGLTIGVSCLVGKSLIDMKQINLPGKKRK